MPMPKPPLSAWVASSVLAALTLFVFGVLQDYGPEATLRRFHQAAVRAVATNDWREIAYLSYQPDSKQGTPTDSTRIVARGAAALVNTSQGKFQLYAMSRRQDRAAAVVTYRVPANPYAYNPVPFPWILRRSERVWKVDTAATRALWNTQ
jgi:hypothetical protein